MPFETPALTGTHLYSHLGVQTTHTDGETGETLMPVHDDIRCPGGLRAGPLGLAFESGAGTFVFARVAAVPTQIALHVRDRGHGVEAIRARTRAVRIGRTIVLTDGEIFDAHDASRIIAFGSITWSVVGEASPIEQRAASAQPDRDSNRPSIIDAAGIRPLPDGAGCQLTGVSEQIAGPGGILHAGVLQLMTEEAALLAAGQLPGGDEGVVTDCAYNFLQAAKNGPFIASSEVLYSNDAALDCRVRVRDVGNDDRVASVSYLRVALGSPRTNR